MLDQRPGALTVQVVEEGSAHGVHLLSSGCAPDGSLVLIRAPRAMKLHVAFDDDGSVRDHTGWMADFAMIGWFHAAGGSPEPAESMEIAHLGLVDATVDEIEAWWVHPASGASHFCDGVTLLEHVARGIAVQIAEGVANDLIAEDPVPADAATFDDNAGTAGGDQPTAAEPATPTDRAPSDQAPSDES